MLQSCLFNDIYLIRKSWIDFDWIQDHDNQYYHAIYVFISIPVTRGIGVLKRIGINLLQLT